MSTEMSKAEIDIEYILVDKDASRRLLVLLNVSGVELRTTIVIQMSRQAKHRRADDHSPCHIGQ